jgi:hypothetical protein
MVGNDVRHRRGGNPNGQKKARLANIPLRAAFSERELGGWALFEPLRCEAAVLLGIKPSKRVG